MEDGGCREDAPLLHPPSSIFHPPSSTSAHGIFRVLTVCRLVEKKGVDTLLRAMARFGESSRQFWQLTIAGEGPEWEGLKKLAAELGVSDRVEFLGAVDNEKVRELLGSADLFVLACRTDAAGDRDGIPVVLMEAMASGVPVISGDLPAIRELIEPNVAGLLVDGSDARALADSISAVANDRALREKLAMGGRAAVEREFSLDINVTRLENLLERSMRRGHGTREMETLRLTESPGVDRENDSRPSRRYALITPLSG